MSVSFSSRRTACRPSGWTAEKRYFPRKKHCRPLRFVGIGIIAMIAVVYLMYKLMVR